MSSENSHSNWTHTEERLTKILGTPSFCSFSHWTLKFSGGSQNEELTIQIEPKPGRAVKLLGFAVSYNLRGSPPITKEAQDLDDGKGVIVIPALVGEDGHLSLKATFSKTCCKEFQNALSDFEELFSSKKGYDVTFEVAGEIIPAHKSILIARVPYFERMFASGMKEALTDRVKIEDADPEAFKWFLKFLYCGKFMESSREHVKSASLLSLADKYGVDDLKYGIADYYVDKPLFKKSVCQMLVLADRYSLTKLKTTCLERMNEWRSSLDEKDLKSLLDHPHLAIEFMKKV